MNYAFELLGTFATNNVVAIRENIGEDAFSRIERG